MAIDRIVGMIVLAFVALIMGYFMGFITAAGMNEQDKEEENNGNDRTGNC